MKRHLKAGAFATGLFVGGALIAALAQGFGGGGFGSGGGGSGSGDIDSVTAGSGLTGGGASGAVTVDIGAGTGISVTANAIAWDTAVFDTCAEIAAIIGGETGTCGSVVLSVGPSLTGVIDTGAATSLEVPNGAAPSLTVQGQIAFDNDYLGGNGFYLGYDGAEVVYFVAIQATDVCTDGQVPKYNATPDTFTCEDDGGGAGATEFDDIGDPSGNGAVALAATIHTWTSTLDSASGVVLELLDSDAALANAVVLWQASFNDDAGAQAIGFRMVTDADTTPAVVFSVTGATAVGSAIINLGATGVTLADDDDGALVITGASTGSDEAISINLDDTADTVVIASTTGVVTFTLTSMSLTAAGADVSGGTLTAGTFAGTIDAGGATSFEVPNGAAPTTNAFGEVAGDNDAWAASHGAMEFFDGTVSVFVIGITSADTCANGDGPMFNTDGTWTCEPLLATVADPGADYIMFWDDSDSHVDFLTTNACLTISGNTLTLATTCDAIINSVSLEAAGVSMTGDDDGAITFLGLGNGSDEDLTMNLDDTSNTVVWSSSTSVSSWTLTGMSITAPGGNFSGGTFTVGVVAGAIDTGAATSLEIPNGAAPTVAVAGQIGFDTNYWGALGGFVGYDGAAIVGFVAIQPDTCTDGQVAKYNATPDTWTCEDDASGGTTEFDDLGDPSGNGAVALANTTHVWTSTLDTSSGAILTILNSDAAMANATTTLTLSFNDDAGAEMVAFAMVSDADGTPAINFRVLGTAAVGSAMLELGATGVRISDDDDGALVILGASAGSDEDFNLNLDDTADTWVFSSSTGVVNIDFAMASMTLHLGTAGVSISEDGDGAITFTGRGNGSDEALTLNLDDTSNTGVFSSTTSLATLDFGGFTLTNFVYNVESTGNVLTTVHEVSFPVAVCQNATATLGGNTASTLAPTAVCETTAAASGDPAQGFATFPTGGADTEWHQYWGRVPTGFTGNFDAIIHWRAVSTTTNDVVWRVAVGCVAASEALTAISFNTTTFTADTNLGTTLQLNDTATTTLTTTGCAAGEQMYFKVLRDTDTAGDTLDADVQLQAITFIYRKAQ